MKNDLIVTTEDSFMEGAMSSFPASDPPSYMAGAAISGAPPTKMQMQMQMQMQMRKPRRASIRRALAMRRKSPKSKA